MRRIRRALQAEHIAPQPHQERSHLRPRQIVTRAEQPVSIAPRQPQLPSTQNMIRPIIAGLHIIELRDPAGLAQPRHLQRNPRRPRTRRNSLPRLLRSGRISLVSRRRSGRNHARQHRHRSQHSHTGPDPAYRTASLHRQPFHSVPSTHSCQRRRGTKGKPIIMHITYQIVPPARKRGEGVVEDHRLGGLGAGRRSGYEDEDHASCRESVHRRVDLLGGYGHHRLFAFVVDLDDQCLAHHCRPVEHRVDVH